MSIPTLLLSVATIVLGAQQVRTPVGMVVLALGVLAIVFSFVRVHGV